MKRRTRPNKFTFPFLLKACSQLSDLQREKQIQAEVVKNGVDSDVYIQNTLYVSMGLVRRLPMPAGCLMECALGRWYLRIRLSLELGNLNVGKWVHSQVIVKGLVVNLQLGTTLLNMYSKCGVIDLAL
ncbi:hypothetical protein MRB53_016886 [Persea americana]|uniref:Uncharacterized protein n=1 Tax=Persea americana TaxID=3435 RepID=A0ACC2M3D8_PERAE|nr:hypothetical protein MRB53_016886 [Persea americana]